MLYRDGEDKIASLYAEFQFVLVSGIKHGRKTVNWHGSQLQSNLILSFYIFTVVNFIRSPFPHHFFFVRFDPDWQSAYRLAPSKLGQRVTRRGYNECRRTGRQAGRGRDWGGSVITYLGRDIHRLNTLTRGPSPPHPQSQPHEPHLLPRPH